MLNESTGFNTHAYSVTLPSCISHYTMTHEIGHNSGLTHDRATEDNEPGVKPYAFGYVNCGSTGVESIMAYDC